MGDAPDAAGGNTVVTGHRMSLLDVQSEQLAIKLQQEAGGDTAAADTDTDRSRAAPGDFSTPAALDGSTPAAGSFPEFSSGQQQQQQQQQQTKTPYQGAWGTPGRSGADVLRSAHHTGTSAGASTAAAAAAASASVPSPSPPSPRTPRVSQQPKEHTVAAAAETTTRIDGSGLGAAAAAAAAVPLSADAVGTMVGMGIEEAWAAAALRRCGGADVIRAVDFCFSHDMRALAEEDARRQQERERQQDEQQQQQQQQQQPDTQADSDMALAMALDQEERRAFEVRRSAAATSLATEHGSFGPKIRFASSSLPSAGTAAAADAGVSRPNAGADASRATCDESRPRRWGADDADALLAGVEEEEEEGDSLGCSPANRQDGDGFDRGEGGSGDAGDGGGGFRAIPGGGRRKGKMPLFRNSEGVVVSKHDAVICGRMNARDASNMDGVGDLTAAGVRLGNRTFNSLKRDIGRKKEKGMASGGRVEAATRSTQEGVMDPRTRLLVFKMVNAGTLLEIHGMVKTGKEAHVYHALAPEDPESSVGSRGVALKIFKTTLNEFGNRAAYVDADPRYANVNMKFSKQSRQKMFTIWAKKEHRNLVRLHRAGIPCPEPIKQREHTLILSFIGKDHWPAPQLREIDLSKANWRRCYAQVLELARLMFLKCRLVHADLSEYNVLYHEKICHVIDVGQAVDTGHPKSREFLRRDLSVVESFFQRKGVLGGRLLGAELAERFVVDYRGPSCSSCEAQGGGGEDHSVPGDGDEKQPLSGIEVALKLMECSAGERSQQLRDMCADAEPWVTRVASSSDSKQQQQQEEEEEEMHDDAGDDADDDSGEISGDGPSDMVGGAPQVEKGAPREGKVGGEGGQQNDGPSVCGSGTRVVEEGGASSADDRASTGRTPVEAEDGEEEEEEESGWTVIDVDVDGDGVVDVDVDLREGGTGTTTGTRIGEKVELSERERSRTATMKEELRAGVF